MNESNTYMAKPANTARMMQWQRLVGRARLVHGARKLGIAIATTLLITSPILSQATPLDLATAPLYLSGTVQPNIFFLADDSGSMDWNTVTSEADGRMKLTGKDESTTYSYIFPQANSNYSNTGTSGRILPSEAAVDGMSASSELTDRGGVWRARYSGYNTLYYNPDVTYLPWAGVDSAGVAFANATPTAARLNPYYVSTLPSQKYLGSGAATTPSNLVDLTAVMSWTADNVPKKDGGTTDLAVTNYYPAQYYTWTDKAPLNGVVDAGDTHALYEIRSASDSSCTTSTVTGVTITCPTTFSRPTTRTDCATASACTRTEELQNFANWFSYYRRRVLTSKNAIGKVIAPSQSRMGLGTLHNNGTVDTEISLMNASPSSGNKKTLLDAVYKNFGDSDTPLRTKLDEVGKYYECTTGSIFASPACPIVSAASGGACQKNFTVMTTDGYYNDSYTGVGNTDTDGTGGYDGGAYSDGWSDTLADIAMHYYERDLSTLDNLVAPAGGDLATHQHMVTYTVAFGVNGTLTTNPTNLSAAFAWPNPTTSDATKIDDLRHAAFNSRGQFLSARDPVGLSTALSDALGSISAVTSSASAVAVNSHTLSTNTTVYQARFSSGAWSGDLHALPIDADGIVGATTLWEAGAQLKLQNWDTGRHIITHNGTTGVAFRWDNLSAGQQASLHDNPATVAVDSDTYGPNRLNWLRGEVTTSAPGNTFRTRQDSASVAFTLGDLANSAPVYVGAPETIADSVETVAHSTFSAAKAARAHVIYVGGNDGMLHGFDASTGNELLAYVPSMLYPNLSKLTDPAYSHRYYVDGSPAAGDAFFGGAWHTVLVSGLAGGGKGVFALDVTDPSLYAAESTASAIALWELSATADNDLGYTFSQPTITKVKTGTGTYKWVAIFGNGYNSTNESAALYVVDIQNGTVLRKIVVDTGSNGLSTPRVFDENGDYIADYVYAGDLKGNLWKFDLTGDQSAWAAAYGTSGVPQPLFKAVDSTGVAQPITERPAVSKHPITTNTGYMVYVGTGRFVDNGDDTPPANPKHTFYGIWDKGVASTAVPVARVDLLPQTISEPSTTTRSITETPIVWRASGTTACMADGSGQCLGWRVDLPTAGEMSVTNPVLLTTLQVNMPRIIFTTLISKAGACSAESTGWLMELDPVYGGLLPAPVVDTNGDGKIDSTDTRLAGIDLGIGIPSEAVIIYDPANQEIEKVLSGSTGAVVTVEQPGKSDDGGGGGGGGSSSTGRKSWRQLR